MLYRLLCTFRIFGWLRTDLAKCLDDIRMFSNGPDPDRNDPLMADYIGGLETGVYMGEIRQALVVTVPQMAAEERVFMP